MNQTTSQVSSEPIYNIGAVSRMTGIAIPTLRAWERRYGFPESGRTSGGHRLYSEKDISCLRWVKEQIDGGMRASKAIRALECGAEGASPLAARLDSQAGEPLAVQAVQAQLVQALVAHNTAAADLVLGQALLVHRLDDLILDAIGPAMAEIGQTWMEGRIDVATEHLATNYLRHRMQTWAMSSAPPRPVPPVALACAPGELHEGSLLILSALLRRRGWPVVYLGQTVPLPDLARLVRQVKPQALVLAAMLQEAAAALVEWPAWLPEAVETGKPLVGYGGRVFTEQAEWRQRVPGIFLGTTLREGVQKIESLL